MVRSFGIEKILLSLPTRSDQYNTGPFEVSFTTAASTASTGRKIRDAINANTKSTARFMWY
jgi:hypothetical protein